MHPQHQQQSMASPVRPVPPWVEIVEDTAFSLGTMLDAAIADECLRARFPHWLMLESAICRVSAQALEGLANWHVAAPDLHSVALDWAAEIRDRGWRAEGEARALGVDATPSAVGLEAWRRFAASAASSTQAGEALGAVLLHERLMQGVARQAVSAAVQSVGSASDYLRRRSQPERAIDRAARDVLLNAYSATALATGARRAAGWYQEALAEAMALQHH